MSQFSGHRVARFSHWVRRFQTSAYTETPSTQAQGKPYRDDFSYENPQPTPEPPHTLSADDSAAEIRRFLLENPPDNAPLRSLRSPALPPSLFFPFSLHKIHSLSSREEEEDPMEVDEEPFIPRIPSPELSPAPTFFEPHIHSTPKSIGYLDDSLKPVTASNLQEVKRISSGYRHEGFHVPLQSLQSEVGVVYETNLQSSASNEIDTIPSRDWNEELNVVLNASLQVQGERLATLSLEFVEVATRIAKIIVEERNLPYLRKSIKPLIGSGFAGGSKFRTKGIFFKYAVDQNGLYGSDEASMKIAGHELKSHTALVSCGMIHNLKFGLLTVIDYRGFRLTATSCLPISATHTLVYGSCDGGNSVFTKDPRFNEIMRQCAKILNLKGHYAGVSAQTHKYMYGPCDLEGHLGFDGKYYVLDLARLFPPETPDASKKGSHLYQLLRPELVRKFSKPLSSDAFTLFGRHDSNIHNQEVRDATQFLLHSVIPTLAADLNQAAVQQPFQDEEELEKYMAWLVQELHRNGINIRHLGRVRSLLQNEMARNAILTELVSRVLKNMLRSRLRATNSSNSADYNRISVDFFNLVFGPHPISACFWLDIKAMLAEKYADVYSEQEKTDEFDIRQLIKAPVLFRKLQSVTGVHFREGVDIQEKGGFLSLADFREIEVRAKVMYTIPRMEADATVAIARSTQDEEEVKKLLWTALEKYESVLSMKPDDSEVLCNQGMILSELAALTSCLQTKKQLFVFAHDKFQKALTLCPTDTRSMLAWADIYIGEFARTKDLKESTFLLSRALQLLEQADSLKPGCASNGLARCYALQRRHSNIRM